MSASGRERYMAPSRAWNNAAGFGRLDAETGGNLTRSRRWGGLTWKHRWRASTGFSEQPWKGCGPHETPDAVGGGAVSGGLAHAVWGRVRGSARRYRAAVARCVECAGRSAQDADGDLEFLEVGSGARRGRGSGGWRGCIHDAAGVRVERRDASDEIGRKAGRKRRLRDGATRGWSTHKGSQPNVSIEDRCGGRSLSSPEGDDHGRRGRPDAAGYHDQADAGVWRPCGHIQAGVPLSGPR